MIFLNDKVDQLFDYALQNDDDKTANNKTTTEIGDKIVFKISGKSKNFRN